jgi:hypothetical protein
MTFDLRSLVVVSIGLLSAMARADVTLVQDGKPVAVIVADVPLPAPEAPNAKGAPKKKPARAASESDEAKAVRVLVQWIKKITDADLTVAPEAKPGVPAIYVGKAAIKAGLKLDDIDSSSHEGVRIVVDGQRILIAGQSDEATLKAACRFLEELGCRYFMDGPLGEVYPRSPTLTAKAVTITEKPGLAGRNPKGPSWPDTGWRAWNGAGGEDIHHAHSWGGYVKEDLFAQHPEWFAMGADGKRKPGGWICTSNKELRKYFAQQVIASIERGNTHPSLSPTDGRGYCQCPDCKAQDNPKSFEPSTGTISITDRYVDFFDDVARQVAAVHPKSVLSFICYADYTQPPTSPRKLSPNLCAVIAPIRYCRLHEIGHPNCESRKQQMEMTEGWAKVASKMGYYNYMYNLADGTLPSFKFTANKKEFPYLQSKGVSFMTIEVLSNWQIYGPQIYLSLRLAYNPQADADAIMEDYWQKFYGPAAPFMKDYWMGIDAEMEKLNSHAGSFYGLQQIYKPQFLSKCEALLAKAAQAAKGNEMYEKRVALHAEGFKSAVEYRQISDATARGEFAKANETLEQMIARLGKLGEQRLANSEYGKAYIERFLAKPVRAAAAATAAPNKLLQVFPDQWKFTIDKKDEGVSKNFQAADFDDSKWATVATYSATLDAQGHEDSTNVLWYRNKFTVPKGHGRLTLFFGEIDGLTEVYLNGKRVAVPTEAPAPKKPAKGAKPAPAAKAPAPAAAPANAPASPATAPAAPTGREGMGKPRAPFEVDISDAVRDGENVLSLRVDHTRITELALGGILRPVALIEKPASAK